MGRSGRPLGVAIVDDFPLVVEGLVGMLAPYGERVRVLVVNEETRTPPQADLALVDPVGVVGEPLDVPSVCARTGTEKAVGYSWDLDPALVEATLAAGATGYLGKTLGAAELLSGLERVHRGETVVTVAPVLERSEAQAVGLTPREAEIIGLITAGLSNQDIADRRYLSINSVKSYIRSSYRKMGVNSRSQAVLWGVEHGLRAERPPRALLPDEE